MYVPQIDFEKWMNRKRCFVKIRNRDNLCCARALGVTLPHNNKGVSQKAGGYYRQVCNSKKPQKEGVLYIYIKYPAYPQRVHAELTNSGNSRPHYQTIKLLCIPRIR